MSVLYIFIISVIYFTEYSCTIHTIYGRYVLYILEWPNLLSHR